MVAGDRTFLGDNGEVRIITAAWPLLAALLAARPAGGGLGPRRRGGRAAAFGLTAEELLLAESQLGAELFDLLLEEGLTLAHSMPYPYAEGRLLHVYSAMHAQKREPQPTRERLEAARAIFRLLGARKETERVEQALAALHVR